MEQNIMWPYNKPEIEPGPADCPECSADSPGLYQERDLIMSEFCDRCKTIFIIMQEIRLKFQKNLVIQKE
jgi:hypothetical protein